MKKVLLLSLSLAASFNCHADWHDVANVTPEPPPEELAAAAAAAAPGAIPSAQNTTAVATTMSDPAPTPSHVDVLPAPVQAPGDEERSTTPVAPTMRAARPTSIILHDAMLRTRPTLSASGDRIAAETRVRLESNVSNAEGNWWFVTATGIGGGWMLEKELGDPQN